MEMEVDFQKEKNYQSEYEKSEEYISIVKENSDKINSINNEFNLIDFIKNNFTESEKNQIENIYFNKPRFNIIFADVHHVPYKYIMGFLQYNLDNGNVMNGIKETIISIELKKAKFLCLRIINFKLRPKID